jgi:hypothetical protein
VSSAVLQLQAILHYLALYNQAVQDVKAGYDALESFQQLQAILLNPNDFAIFQLFLNNLSIGGFSADDLTILDSLGLDPSLVAQLLSSYTSFSDSGNLGADLASLSSGFSDISNNQLFVQIPEPPSIVVLLFGSVVIMATMKVSRRRWFTIGQRPYTLRLFSSYPHDNIEDKEKGHIQNII